MGGRIKWENVSDEDSGRFSVDDSTASSIFRDIEEGYHWDFIAYRHRCGMALVGFVNCYFGWD